GMTARAAILACRERGAARVVLAAPVCARESAADLSREADELVCVLEPDYFSAVGRWYIDFSQVEQDEAVGILRANRTQAPAAQHPGGKA
ncbi:MAG: phosphoribosyltransferase, partial [Fimbriimonas ginsengisoli]|nr:phosphoribosyltransferase [Fimbriimonas ginsengisoli]